MSLSKGVAGQGIVVTGAASGIGRASATLLAASGARLFLLDRDERGLTSVAGDIQDAGGDVAIRVANIASVETAGVLASEAADALGAIDGAVYAAGINRITPAVDIDMSEWVEVLGVNLTGAFFLLQAIAREMTARATRGAFVAITATAAVTPMTFRGLTSDCASKAGLGAVVKCLAVDLAPSIRVNAVAPGPVDTPMIRGLVSPEEMRDHAARTPLGRVGEAEDIATAVRFLLSNDSAFVTGQTLHVNGGMFLAS